jgi:hypothetical protein
MIWAHSTTSTSSAVRRARRVCITRSVRKAGAESTASCGGWDVWAGPFISPGRPTVLHGANDLDRARSCHGHLIPRCQMMISARFHRASSGDHPEGHCQPDPGWNTGIQPWRKHGVGLSMFGIQMTPGEGHHGWFWRRKIPCHHFFLAVSGVSGVAAGGSTFCGNFCAASAPTWLRKSSE